MLWENKYYLHLLIQSGPHSQTAPHHRLVIPEEVVMQPHFTVSVLVLQSEGLVSSSRYVGFTLQFTPTIIIPEPQEVAVGQDGGATVAVEVELIKNNAYEKTF